MNREQRRHQARHQQLALKKARQYVATLEQANDAARITDVARLLTEHREWTLAIDCYRRLAQLSPKDTEILMQLAYTLANAGHMKWAFEVYRSVLALNPTHLACRKNMCVLLFTAGHLQEALRWAKQLEAIAPADPEIAYFLGEIHAELDESAPSIQAYRAAVEQFRAAYRFRDPDTATLIKIARCLIALGELAKAGQCLKQVLVQAPVLPVAHFQMGQLFERMGQPDNALRAYRHCLKIAPDHTETLMAYSALMAEKGRLDRSAWAYRRLLLQAPDDASLKHLLKATSQPDDRTGADERYVQDVFDAYAAHFDDHLVNTLSYQVPELAWALYARTMPSRCDLFTVDLGCGTGLCGPYFRSLSKRLVGIDLSASMLDKAAERQCYDALAQQDLVAGLRPFNAVVDLALAADVFVYVGDLASVFVACVRALAEGGHLLFSVESTTHPSGVVLHPSGRYQHSDAYILAMAQAHHFSVVVREAINVRMENGHPVKGALFLLQKERLCWGV